MSLRSEPTAGEKEGEGKKGTRQRESGIGPGQDRGNKPHKMKEPNTKKEGKEKRERDVERDRTKSREDQCKTNIVCYRVKTNTQHNGQLWRATVFTPGSLMLALTLQHPEKMHYISACTLLESFRGLFLCGPKLQCRAINSKHLISSTYNYKVMLPCCFCHK